MERRFICEILQEQIFNPLSDTIPIKYLNDGTKVLSSFISASIKESNCSNAQRIVVRHCKNGIHKIQVVDINHSYIPLAYADHLRINITIIYIHRLTDRFWDVSNDFQNKHFLINEIVCVSLPQYNMEWIEQYYPNFIIS